MWFLIRTANLLNADESRAMLLESENANLTGNSESLLAFSVTRAYPGHLHKITEF